MIIVILKLFLAHIVGDFFLQPAKWVKSKEKKKLKSVWLYVHIAIHIVLMLIIFWDLALLWLILTVGVAHFIIDATKLLLQNKETKRIYFFIDQLLHIASILILGSLYFNNNFEFITNLGNKELLLLICVLFLMQPTSLIMRTIFSKWNISKITKGNESLKDAGNYIGILERLLVFTFIAIGQWSAVGFLITAKSVFRFGDLTSTKERKLTEYILIGTLFSFGISIAVSLIYLSLKYYV